MGTLFAQAVAVSVYANVEALLISAAGAFAVHRQVIGPGDLKAIGRMCIKVLFPALSFSFFQTYSAELLLKWSSAALISGLSLILGALLGLLGGRLLRLPRPYDKMLVLCTTFGNVGALPFVLVPPIVTNWRRVKDDPAAIDKGFSIIPVYAIIWSLALFGAGKPYALSMRAAPPPSEEAGGEAAAAKAATPLKRQPPLRRALAAVFSLEPPVYCGLLAMVRRALADSADLATTARHT